jgi:4-amino-4-deoxy-L-arabinose transferase-like glycosyltransferase
MPADRRRETWIVVLLVLAGFALRVWALPTDGLDHYDEGVYAFSGLGVLDASQPHRLFPHQERFSPLAYVGLVSLSYRLAGFTSDRGAILVNIVLGTCTIPLLWALGRRWFGAVAGLVAAALLTFNELHILLSRSALTDVTFTFFFIIALGFLVEAFERRHLLLAIAGGVMTGLAWNTKYHGWFALVAAAMAIAAHAWASGRSLTIQSGRRLLLLWLVAAVTAAACYLPWALAAELRFGGYQALAQYQSSLLSRHWIDNVVRQASMLEFLDGPWTRASVFIAMAAALAVRPAGVTAGRLLTAAAIVTALAIWVGGLLVAVVVAACAVPLLFRTSRSFASSMTLAWLALWFLSTPMYRPYFRLVLPGTIAVFVAAGAWCASYARGPRQDLSGRFQWALPALLAVLVGVMSARFTPGNPWRPRRSIADAAAAMERIIPNGERVIVVGEPAAAFYLHLSGRPAFDEPPPESIHDIRERSFLVTGPYAHMGPLRVEMERLGDRLQMLSRYPIDPGDLRLLDDYPPAEARRFRAQPDEDFALTLYRLAPAP